MEIIKLYAELLANPKSIADYKKLIAKYKNCNMLNEANAFQELIQRKFNADSSPLDQK